VIIDECDKHYGLGYNLKSMDYLGLHSVMRWVVYVVCAFVIARALPAWFRKRDFIFIDYLLWIVLLATAIIQTILGFLTFATRLNFSVKVLEHMFIGVIVTGLPLMFSVWNKADNSKRFRVFFVTGLVCLMLSVVGVSVFYE